MFRVYFAFLSIFVFFSASFLHAGDLDGLFGDLPHIFSFYSERPGLVLGVIEEKFQSFDIKKISESATKVEKRQAKKLADFLNGLGVEKNKFLNAPFEAYMVTYIAFDGVVRPYRSPSDYLGIARFRKGKDFKAIKNFLAHVHSSRKFDYQDFEGRLYKSTNPHKYHHLVQNGQFVFFGRNKNKIYELEKVSIKGLNKNDPINKSLALYLNLEKLNKLNREGIFSNPVPDLSVVSLHKFFIPGSDG
ncbi:hypothetical protein ACFL35_07205 [Candidatus Riflebacteria bacterium]